ncbi:vWA domain-containing protein [Isosphaeraceae bacterium EP7]
MVPRILVGSLLVITGMSMRVIAEEPKTVAESPATVVVTQADESKFPEIELAFEVRKSGGAFVLDAEKGAFRVTEYDLEVPVLEFEAPISTERKPTTIVLVVDHSGSMGHESRIDGMKRAVGTFLEGLPAGSRVAVVAFSTEVRVVCPFTTDFKAVKASVDELEPFGATSFFDAVDRAVELLGDETGRRAVLALTDGIDTSSTRRPESVVERARKFGLPVHTLGLGDERQIAVDLLKAISEETRGQAYLARQVDQLKSIYEELAKRLGSSYRLIYRSERAIPDGTLRPVKVYYRGQSKAGEAAVFIPGMVVPAPVGSFLFLTLVGGLLVTRSIAGRSRRAEGASS